MPTRQAVFNLAVRPRVLLEHRDSNSVIRQNFRRHRPGNRTANYRHEMTPRIRHSSSTPRIAARLYNANRTNYPQPRRFCRERCRGALQRIPANESASEESLSLKLSSRAKRGTCFSLGLCLTKAPILSSRAKARDLLFPRLTRPSNPVIRGLPLPKESALALRGGGLEAGAARRFSTPL